jgi:HAD superfamily hydrolase (TIGR01490 family)
MTSLVKQRPTVAAFFDLDGTIIPGPSLERRLFRMLRNQGAISSTSYLLWLAQAARLAPHGLSVIAHTNKMYLRGVPVNAIQTCLPSIFPDALDRVAWHVTQGHTVVLVSGTLAPLARAAALTLTLRLVSRGFTASIGVCATQVEEARGRLTGRIAGEPVFAQGKARAICRLARQSGFDLTRCYAYGDSATDRWMLGAVGRPVAVNPSRELHRIARLLDWPVLHWSLFGQEDHDTHAGMALGKPKPETLG